MSQVPFRWAGVALCGAFLISACEEDALAPVNDFKGEECQDFTNCGEGNYRLDSGTLDMGSVVGDMDAGDPNGGTDSGPGGADGGVADTGGGALDAGTPDTGLPPQPSVFLNLAGTYVTKYQLDVSDYLFGISGAADVIDLINRVLHNGPITGNSIVDALIINGIQSSGLIPPWLPNVFATLDEIANLMDTFEVENGSMNVSQELPVNPTDLTTRIHATETWGTFYIHLISRCPGGRADANWPACARVPIALTASPVPITTANGTLDVRIYIKPFDGVLNAGVPEADFEFQDREVQLELGSLVLVVANTLTAATTGYPNFQTAVQSAVNCPGLGMRAYTFAMNVGLGSIVAVGLQIAAEDECNDLIQDLVDAVANISVDWDAFEFTQRGHARDTNPQDGQNRAEILEVMSAPSGPDRIDGHFSFAIGTHLGGVWDGHK